MVWLLNLLCVGRKWMNMVYQLELETLEPEEAQHRRTRFIIFISCRFEFQHIKIMKLLSPFGS